MADMGNSPDRPEKLASKLIAVFEGHTHLSLAEVAGVTGPQIGNYTRGSTPGPLQLFRLARYLNVSLDWLIDDAQPVKPIRRPGSTLTSAQLQLACLDKYVELANEFSSILDRCDTIDWASIAKQLEQINPKEVPNEADDAMRIAMRKPRIRMEIPDELRAALQLFAQVMDFQEHTIEPLATWIADLTPQLPPGTPTGQQLFDHVNKICGRLCSTQTGQRMGAGYMAAQNFVHDPDRALALVKFALEEYHTECKLAGSKRKSPR